MGTLQDIKYRSIMDLIKYEEPFDKKQRVISGLEAFYLCHKRYESLQNIIAPLKSKLGKDVIITSINFTNAMQDETGIVIKYIKDNRLYMMVITMVDLEIVDIVLSDSLITNEEFLEKNHDLFSKVVYELDYYDYLSEPEIKITSSSKRFIINDNCNDFIIKSSEEKMFSIGNSHRLYNIDGNFFNSEKVISDNPKLTEELMDGDNIQKIYSNLRIYEDYFPKRLIKKIT